MKDMHTTVGYDGDNPVTGTYKSSLELEPSEVSALGALISAELESAPGVQATSLIPIVRADGSTIFILGTTVPPTEE